MNEALWKRLLAQIRDGLVVPVVGPRLLVEADGSTSLQASIAERLLSNHGVDVERGSLPPFRELNEAYTRLKDEVIPEELYGDIHDLLQESLTAPGAAAPVAIRQLSEIADFRLIVTLTPDDWLARSLKRRCAVNEIVHSPNWPADESRDLTPGWNDRAGEVQLLYLFGKARSAPMFAIHDEDVLEYAHNMVTRAVNVPSAFLGALRERSLLLVGCNFPDWLGRLFLRDTNKSRLSEKGKRGWMVEQLTPEEGLTCFLRSYSKETEVLSQLSPVDFVAELHRRWKEGHGGASESESLADSPNPRGTIFFVSYSRVGDLPRAQALVDKLKSLGAAESEVWFDQKSIEPGQDFRYRILDGIRDCRYFLALLSDHANRREEAFVFNEWREANLRQKQMNRRFIVPVVIDGDFEPLRYTAAPTKEWSDLDFGFAPNGIPDDKLAERLKTWLREVRSMSSGH